MTQTIIPLPPASKITITGDLGSGKSTVSKNICAAFAAEFYSTGIVWRSMAEQMGISVLELNQRAETDMSIDRKVDDVLKTLNHDKRTLVVDSRLAWHFLQVSYKIKLECDLDIAVKRIINDPTRKIVENFADPKMAAIAIIERRKSENKRYGAYYGVDIESHHNFDLVINTSYAPAVDVASLIIEHAPQFFAGKKTDKHWTLNSQGQWESRA